MRDEMPAGVFLAILAVMAVVYVTMAVRAGEHRKAAEWLGWRK